MWIYNISTDDWAQSQALDSLGKSVWENNGNNRLQAVSNPAVGMSWYAGATDQGFAKRDLNVAEEIHEKREEVVAGRELAKRASVEMPFIQSLDQDGGLAWNGNKDDSAPPLMDGNLVYLRAGKSGVLVAFGGEDPYSHDQFAQSSLNDLRDMMDIYIFDIESNKW
jgi:hypothetical protein